MIAEQYFANQSGTIKKKKEEERDQILIPQSSNSLGLDYFGQLQRRHMINNKKGSF